MAFSCTDRGSGVATCAGTQPSGSPLNTLLLGTRNFVVDATDAVGNHSQLVANYRVSAPVCQDGDGGHGGRNEHGQVASTTCYGDGFHHR